MSHSVTSFLLALAIVLAACVIALVFWRRSNERNTPQAQHPAGGSGVQTRHAPSLQQVLHHLETERPLEVRPLMRGPAEQRVWLWLRHEVFPKHHVLPKVPLTRFTAVRSEEHGHQWFNLLSSTYCSFTVCGNDGRVLGCIDVIAAGDFAARGSVSLKYALLSQCGVPYRVLSAEKMPDAKTLAVAFLGSNTQPAPDQHEQLAAMRQHLHDLLDKNRRQREQSGFYDNLGWQQKDSFFGAIEEDSVQPSR